MRKVCKGFFLAQLAFVACFHIVANAETISPSGSIEAGRAHLRTSDAMEAAMLSAGNVSEAAVIPFRPTMNEDDYKAAKAAASVEIGQAETEALNVSSTAVTLKGINIDGANQTEGGGWRPPDTHGAVGPSHFVEVTNSHLDMYDKTGVRVKSVTLASFFGYTTKPLFDPRCVYDKAGGRWIITAEAFPEDSKIVQMQCIAASKTSDPTGAYWIYIVNVNTNKNDDFWDYPQLGFNKEAIFITANIFGQAGPYRDTRMIALPKDKIYAGAGWSAPLFSKLTATLAPPIVLDTSVPAFFAAAPNNNKAIKIYKFTGMKKKKLTTFAIPVKAYTIPPPASQPGTTKKLDTIDNRFQNASIQNGTALWQVHTVNNGGRPSVRWYQFKTSSKKVTQQGTLSASATSHDWNASIVANASNDVFVTWSSTLETTTTNAQVRFSGRLHTDPLNVISAGSALFTSTTFYNTSSDNPERWGDYSAVTVDPSNTQRAFIVNEKINSATVWGTRIGDIGF